VGRMKVLLIMCLASVVASNVLTGQYGAVVREETYKRRIVSLVNQVNMQSYRDISQDKQLKLCKRKLIILRKGCHT